MEKVILLKLLQTVWLRVGLNLTRPTKLMNFAVIFIFVILAMICTLAVLVPILGDRDLTTIADTFQICSPVTQVIIKLFVVKYSMEKVRAMLHTIETQFWTTAKFGSNIALKLFSFEKLINKVFKYTLHGSYIFATILFFRPLVMFNGPRQYPFILYNIVDIHNDKMYALMYGYLTLVFIIGPNVLMAVDGLYILFTINIYVQLTMLKHAFTELRIDEIKDDEDEERVYFKLKEYIYHHDLMLKFIKDFGELYSFQILCQFLGNTLSICMGIFLFYGNGTDIASLIRTFIIITVFIVELIFFCVGGTLISDLCQDIAPAVFYNGWERMYSKRIRFAILMIVMRSNKPEIIKAGKMVDVNLTSIGQVLKLAVSTFTLMNNINANKVK